MMKAEVDSMKKALKKSKDKPKVIDVKSLLGTGSTILNLACSGHIEGGFLKGTYCLLIGDSDSGKTWLSLSCMAEACLREDFDDYHLIFDGPEHGALMDIAHYFGQGLADRLEPPGREEDGSPMFSTTVEDFYFFLDDLIKAGKKFIYVLDSMDVLSSEAEGKKFKEDKTAIRKGKDPKGSYGDNKAKINSSRLRRVVGQLPAMGSVLLIVNQTRDAIDAGLFAPKKTRSGGWALEFYSTITLWSTVGGQIKKTVRKKERQVGILSKVKIKRTRVTGRKYTVTIPIYHDHGIDDVGSCVDYLVGEGVWKNTGGVITVTGLGPTFKGDMDEVVAHIEKADLVPDLQAMVGKTWSEIEKLSTVKRKNRYSND